MQKSGITHIVKLSLATLALLLFITACNTTRSLNDKEYLLRGNSVKLKSDKLITQKGELKENLSKLIVQKPNTRILGFPYKLWLYDTRYKKYETDTGNFQLQSKTVEKPVIYDSSTIRRSATTMKGYLFHQGYFYATITDTSKFKGKMAYVTYNVETGTNYLISSTEQDIDDTTIARIVKKAAKESVLITGSDFSYTQLEQEQGRITALLRNFGYYKFSNDNVSFVLDTMNKQYLKDIANPFESAINFIALQKQQKKPTLSIKMTIRADDDPTAYYRYGINRVRVFPDFETAKDIRDSTMIQKIVDDITFKYHNLYVKPGVVRKHIFLNPETYYSQRVYDQTINSLNGLNIFQSVRIVFREDTTREGYWLNCTILLSPAKKMDFNSSLEGSNGSTYTVGSALTLSLRNRNFAKGANLLTTSLTGSLETIYNDTIGNNFFKHFGINTRSVGANASIEFPKFLVPFSQKNLSPTNVPHTIVSIGASLLDRVGYFTLYNFSTNFAYRWKETDTKRWEIAPAFINYIRIPHIDSSFEARIKDNDFLKNTYKNTFIEGENIAFIFSDKEKKLGKNYNYLKLSGEEAGGLMGLVGSVVKSVDTLYAQYVKFDFDAQHFVTFRHSTVALRFYGGVGMPYGKSSTLPYIKQYFVGGPYSIRGWHIRQLGPGSYVDPAVNSDAIIDRTGDIKLEMNAEYRFDIIKLFSGAIKMNGALFSDAGNIWLAKKSAGFPDGEFAFDKLGTDIAVSSGAGIRFDISGFFVVRFDFAIPVKKPGYSSNDGWVFNEIDLGNSSWRKDNIIFNLAIGYPF